MNIRHKMSFDSYSNKVIDLMINTSVGKPFRDTEGEIIGEIVEVNRTDNSKVLEFITELKGGDIFED